MIENPLPISHIDKQPWQDLGKDVVPRKKNLMFGIPTVSHQQLNWIRATMQVNKKHHPLRDLIGSHGGIAYYEATYGNLSTDPNCSMVIMEFDEDELADAEQVMPVHMIYQGSYEHRVGRIPVRVAEDLWIDRRSGVDVARQKVTVHMPQSTRRNTEGVQALVFGYEEEFRKSDNQMRRAILARNIIRQADGTVLELGSTYDGDGYFRSSSPEDSISLPPELLSMFGFYGRHHLFGDQTTASVDAGYPMILVGRLTHALPDDFVTRAFSPPSHGLFELVLQDHMSSSSRLPFETNGDDDPGVL